MHFYRYTFTLLAIVVSLALYSCENEFLDKDNAKPWNSVATADFSIDKPRVDLFDSVTFTSQSTNAVRLEWDLGNGEFSNALSVKTNYFSPGAYQIRLTAYDKNNLPTYIVKEINVRPRSISGIELSKLEFTSPTGQPWNTDGSGPDIEITCLSIYSSNQPHTVLASWDNVSPSDLPLTATLSGNNLFQLRQGYYTFTIREKSSSRTIALWSIDPNTQSEADANGNGSFVLQSGQNELKVLYITK